MSKDTLVSKSYNLYDREKYENACKRYKYELLIKENKKDFGDSFFSNSYEKIEGVKLGLRLAGMYDSYKLIYHINK